MTAPDHGTQLLKVWTRTGAGRWAGAAKHNLRAIGGSHIDPSRLTENVLLLGPGDVESLCALAHERTVEAGINLKGARSNATRMAEVICGLPVSSPVDRLAYFGAALKWVVKKYGSTAVLSAVIHNDEENPHVHVLMLPMKHGEWKASRLFGGPRDLVSLQDDFFREVAGRFGVRRAPSKMTAKEREENAKLVVAELERIQAPELRGPLWSLVRECIQRSPGQFLERLGLEAHRELKTMAQIFTSKGRGAATAENCYTTSPPPASHLLCSVSSSAGEPPSATARDQHAQPEEVTP